MHKLTYTFFYDFQTITGAMSTLNPPIVLEKPDNQVRVDYIQDYASGVCCEYATIDPLPPSQLCVLIKYILFPFPILQGLISTIHQNFTSTQKNCGKIVASNKRSNDQTSIN